MKSGNTMINTSNRTRNVRLEGREQIVLEMHGDEAQVVAQIGALHAVGVGLRIGIAYPGHKPRLDEDQPIGRIEPHLRGMRGFVHQQAVEEIRSKLIRFVMQHRLRMVPALIEPKNQHAHRPDGTLLLLGAFGKPGKVMAERGVNYPIRLRGALSQHIQVIQGTAQHISAQRRHFFFTFIGARQSKHVMTCRKQIADDGRAYPATCTRYKYTHEHYSEVSTGITLAPDAVVVK